jgi:hypothetical protein
MAEPTIICPNCKAEIKLMEAAVGMYGGLQGIAGKSIQKIDGLELKALGKGSQPENLQNR